MSVSVESACVLRLTSRSISRAVASTLPQMPNHFSKDSAMLGNRIESWKAMKATRKAIRLPNPIRCHSKLDASKVQAPNAPIVCDSGTLTKASIPTEALADAALMKSQRLIGELSKLGLAADSDDQMDISTPTSAGSSFTTWSRRSSTGTASSSESEDDTWRAESEDRFDDTLHRLEEELCLRLRGIEEELRLMRELYQRGGACQCHLLLPFECEHLAASFSAASFSAASLQAITACAACGPIAPLALLPCGHSKLAPLASQQTCPVCAVTASKDGPGKLAMSVP